MREVSRKQENKEFEQLKELFLKVFAQTRLSKDKTYSIHEPDVSCFKGNPHGSKTLEPVLTQISEVINKQFDWAITDRGYRGKSQIDSTVIVTPGPEKDPNRIAAYRENKSRQCKSRAAIEPVISHLKHDHRMLRNYLKGFIADKINAVLAGAAFNFKIKLREIRFNLFCLSSNAHSVRFRCD